jgi:hypothetical protein
MRLADSAKSRAATDFSITGLTPVDHTRRLMEGGDPPPSMEVDA